MTDKFSHTQGPWTIRVATASIPTIHVHSPRGHFASVYGARNVQDARLIAAAPDMLAALKGAELQLRAHKIDCRELSEIRAAIAKAEGK